MPNRHWPSTQPAGCLDTPVRPARHREGATTDESGSAEVIDALGCDPLDLGGLSMARALETFATASAQPAIASGRAPLFATRWLVPGP